MVGVGVWCIMVNKDMRNIVVVMGIPFRDEKGSVMRSILIIYLSRANMSGRLDFKCSEGNFKYRRCKSEGAEQGSQSVNWINESGKDGRTAKACR